MQERKFLEDFVSVFDDVEIDDINLDTIFRDIDEWSSLSALGLLAVVEEEYGIGLSNRDLSDSQTIGDIYRLIRSKKS